MRVESHVTVQAYFHEQVGRAIERQRLQASEMASWYLVNLLVENLRATPDQDEPMAFRLERARHGNASERARQLRDLGDTALYVSGFFRDSLRRSLVRPDYYVTVGVSAYAELQSLLSLPRTGATHVDVYAELADRFSGFADVLRRVSDEAVAPQDISRLLERWLETRSRHLLERLALRGVLISPGGGESQ